MMRAAKLLQQREEEMAASKLQQIYRGRLARRQMLLRKKMKEEHGEMETQSAILIQTRFRGLRARRARHRKISEGREREKAAIRIQSTTALEKNGGISRSEPCRRTLSTKLPLLQVWIEKAGEQHYEHDAEGERIQGPDAKMPQSHAVRTAMRARRPRDVQK